MTEQERVKKPKQEEKTADKGGTGAPDKRGKPETKVSKKKVDEIIDDIDAMIQENPEEFVKTYVQKGGE